MLAIIIGMILFPMLGSLVPLSSFMQISSAMYYITFFLLGLLYCDHKLKVDTLIRKYWWMIMPVFLGISVSLISKGYFAALSGIIFSISLALIVEESCPDKFVRIYEICYAVFLLSYFPQMFIRGPIAHYFPTVNQYILSIISFLSGLLLPILFGLVFLRLKNKCPVID